MQQLSAQDAQFLYIETGNNLTHVMGVNIFDPSTARGGKVRFKDIIAHVEGRLDCSPVFRRRLMRLPYDFDFPYWVEDEFFDIEHHMFHGRLPEPGDWRQFCIHLSRHFSRPMDMNRPLWDMYVIEGLDRIEGIPKGSYAIATRVHHAAIDGASAMHFFNAMSDKDRKGTPAIELRPVAKKGPGAPSTVTVLNRAVWSNIQSPVKMASTLLRFSPAIWGTVRKSFGPDATRNSKVPQTRFNQPVSPHKVFDAAIFRLDDLRRIKAKVEGATINDVVLAISAGALRRYLQHHDELPHEPLVAIAPVNARSSGRQAEMPGNNISAMSVALPTYAEGAGRRRRSRARSRGCGRPARSAANHQGHHQPDQGGQIRHLGAADDGSDQACAGCHSGRRGATGRRRALYLEAVQPVRLQRPRPAANAVHERRQNDPYFWPGATGRRDGAVHRHAQLQR